MTDRRRNALIGAFVLGGLIALGILIVKFGESRWLFSTGYVLWAKFDTVTGVREGTEVTLAGVPVGRVLLVDLLEPRDPAQGVVAKMEIRRQFTVPAGSRAVVIPPLMGQPTIDILPPPIPSFPLEEGGTISGKVVNLLAEAIDPKFMATLEKTTGHIGELAEALKPAAVAITGLLERRTISQVENSAGPGELTANLYTAVERLHGVLKHIETVLGDPENQSNLKETLANFKVASENAKLAVAGLKQFSESAQKTTTQASRVLDNLDATVNTTHQHVDALGKQLAANMDKFSKLMDHLIAASGDLAEGNGTAGLLLRDPKFYQELMLTTQRLGAAADELLVLIKQWQREGLLSSVR